MAALKSPVIFSINFLLFAFYVILFNSQGLAFVPFVLHIAFTFLIAALSINLYRMKIDPEMRLLYLMAPKEVKKAMRDQGVNYAFVLGSIHIIQLVILLK